MRLPISGAILVVLAIPLVLNEGGIRYLPDTATQSSLLVGLILASPIFGLAFLAYRFIKWHARFHRRMRGPRQ